MAWSSTTFKRTPKTGSFVLEERAKQTIDMHRDAMDRVVEDAKRFKQDTRDTVQKIVDPALKKSATR